MNGASVLPLILFAGWWPFAGEPPVHDDSQTIKGLYESTDGQKTTKASFDGSRRDVRTSSESLPDTRLVGESPDTPPQSIEPVEFTTELAAKRAKENYRAFLELAADDPVLSAEAARRLADLQVEASEGKQLDEQRLLLEGAALDEAIELYTRLLETWPDNPQNDRVLYQLARVHEGAGRPDDALATLDRLVAGWPETRYLDEAQFRRGEILFVQKRYADAQAAYEAVLALGPDAAFYDESRYKHGWSLFKQGRHEESLDSFFGVLDGKLVTAESSLVPIESLSRAEHELVDDTLRVLGISFSYLDGARSLDDWFAAHGAPYAHVMYARLGQLYLDKERYTDAAETLQAFVDHDPYHSVAPLLQARAIDAYAKGGFASLVLEAREAFIERYGLDSPYWDAREPDDHPEVMTQLASSLDQVTRHYHAQAQASRKPADYARAAHWYRESLRSLPDRDDASQTRFLLAEVLFESGEFDEATREYEQAAYEYPAHAKSAEAGYAALLAYEKHEAGLTGPERQSWHRQSIDSALRFAGHFPAQPQAGAVLTKAAEDLFALGELEPAIDTGERVVALEPPVDPALARTAWTVIAHARFDLGRFAQAEAAYLRVLGLMAADDAARGNIGERLAASIYKQAEQRQAEGDAEGAVEQFLRVAEAAPASKARAAAEFDAATMLMELESWPRAIAVLEKFRSAHPGHELAGEVTRKLAVAYLADGQGARAAAELRAIADDTSAPSDMRRDALWQSAKLYADAGHAASAAAAYEKYVARYPLPLDAAMDARQQLAELAGKGADRTRWLEAIIAADAAAGEARSDRSRYLAAKAALLLAEPHFDAFAAVRLAIPLEKSLERKKARMQAALDAYARAADYSVAEVTTAATYRIAEIYHLLGSDLLESERPRDLSPEELEQYDVLLEEQAFPFEEKAIELHELNAARAADGAYDEWVRKSYAELAELMPVRYAKAEISEGMVHAIR
ncbi:MAG: tetratricopeptide repeat protein [Gammaproteobacteria bacterium]